MLFLISCSTHGRKPAGHCSDCRVATEEAWGAAAPTQALSCFHPGAAQLPQMPEHWRTHECDRLQLPAQREFPPCERCAPVTVHAGSGPLPHCLHVPEETCFSPSGSYMSRPRGWAPLQQIRARGQGSGAAIHAYGSRLVRIWLQQLGGPPASGKVAGLCGAPKWDEDEGSRWLKSWPAPWGRLTSQRGRPFLASQSGACLQHSNIDS